MLRHSYLVRELVERDVRSRYIGSLIGLFWSVLNPILQLILYTVVFSTVLEIRFGENGSPTRFAEFLFCALLPWMAIQESVSRSARCFVENSNLIKKVRVPLEIFPASIVLSAFIHQLMATAIFAAVLAFNRTLNPPTLLFVLLAFPVQLTLTHGLSLAVSCLNVFFRDVAQIVGISFMLMFWVTPIVYPKEMAAQAGSTLYWVLELNPLTHLIELMRFAFLGSPVPSVAGVVYLSVCATTCFFMGQFILERTRSNLVDLL